MSLGPLHLRGVRNRGDATESRSGAESNRYAVATNVIPWADKCAAATRRAQTERLGFAGVHC